MIHKIFNEIYGKTPASFSAPGSPEDAAKLLSKQSARGFFSRGIVVGNVRADRVVLHQSRPFVRDSFAPQYYGRFVYENGQTQLIGYFMLRPFVKAFMTLWFGMVGLISIICLYIGASEGTLAGIISGLVFSLTFLAFAALGYAFVKFCKELYKGDKEKIKAHIESCFN